MQPLGPVCLVTTMAAAGLAKRATTRMKEEDLGPPAPMRKVTSGSTVISLGASWQLLPNIKLAPFNESKDREIVRVQLFFS